jgi:hypothetical protein
MIKHFFSANVATTVIIALVGIGLIAAPAGLQLAYSQTARKGICGPMDVAIALDDTGSMGGAINSIKSELPVIISQAQTASGGDLQLGYLTFKDNVTVHNQLTTNLAAVSSSISSTFASGGNGAPEASDIAKSTAINNTGSFSAPWRATATKILILITDAPPGGTNDVTDPQDIARMHTAALAALGKGIKVSDVFVPTGGDYAGQAAILKDDASTSGGAFVTTNANGTGTSNAISDIIKNCGNPNGINVVCPETNVQHWDKIVFTIQDPNIAKRANVTANTPLDIKVLDDPHTVADIKQKVIQFLKLPDRPEVRKSISVGLVEYAIICAAAPSPTTGTGKVLTIMPTPPEGTGIAASLKAMQSQQQMTTTNNTTGTTTTPSPANATNSTTTR